MFYDDLCHLRKSLITIQSSSLLNSAMIATNMHSPTSNRYGSKQRSDSEPNIFLPRQHIVTIVDVLQ